MSTTLSLIKLLRPLNLLQGAIAVLVTAALLPEWPQTLLLMRTTAVLVLFTGGANALNDWFDYPIDLINQPDRPLTSGALPRWSALALGIVSFAAGAILALPLAPAARFIALGIAMPILILYTPLFKRQPLIGNFAVAGILGLAFPFAGAAFGYLNLMWVPFGLAAGFNILRELVKDIQDMEGDRADGARTFPVIFGAQKSILLAQFLTLVLMIGILLPYILNVYGALYLTTVIIGVELPLIYSISYLQKHPDPEGCAWVSKVLKIDIFLGLLAVYLSKFDV